MSRYLGDIKLEDFLASEESFDKVMDKVVSVAIERALIHLPRLILAQIRNAEGVKETVDKFYLSNRDLRPYKNMLSVTTTRLCAEHPELPVEEILAMAATEVRSVVKTTTK